MKEYSTLMVYWRTWVFHHIILIHPKEVLPTAPRPDLDMRMNRQGRLTAETIINEYDADRLSAIFHEYGELVPGPKAGFCHNTWTG